MKIHPGIKHILSSDPHTVLAIDRITSMMYEVVLHQKRLQYIFFSRYESSLGTLGLYSLKIKQ